MTRYSDSDSEQSSVIKYRRKCSRRSSSSDSSDSFSSYHKKQKYSKSKKKYRSRSRSKDKDKSLKAHKHLRESSKERRKYLLQKSRSSSVDRNEQKKRSFSREKSTSRSSSSQSNMKGISSEKPSTSSNDNFHMSDTKVKSSVLDEINNDEFIPKEFVSSAKNKELKMKSIVIDINADIIDVPQIPHVSDTSNSIFHTSVAIDKEIKYDKWIKKLHSLRQKIINEFNSV